MTGGRPWRDKSDDDLTGEDVDAMVGEGRLVGVAGPCPYCRGAVGHPLFRCGGCGRSLGESRPLYCQGVTYVSASYSKEYDAFEFEASCDGPLVCGWAVDLEDPSAPSVTEQGMALLSESHHKHSAERAASAALADA